MGADSPDTQPDSLVLARVHHDRASLPNTRPVRHASWNMRQYQTAPQRHDQGRYISARVLWPGRWRAAAGERRNAGQTARCRSVSALYRPKRLLGIWAIFQGAAVGQADSLAAGACGGCGSQCIPAAIGRLQAMRQVGLGQRTACAGCSDARTTATSALRLPPTPVYQNWTGGDGSSRSSSGCCKICTTGKACGDSCISRSYTCHKGPGCACDG